MASIFLGAWLVLYRVRPRHREAMLCTSLFLAPAGPISEFWHLQDYWHPAYLLTIRIRSWSFGLEDYVMAFAAAGVSAWLFEELALRRDWPPSQRKSCAVFRRMATCASGALLLVILLASGLGLRSIDAILVAGVIQSGLALASSRQTPWLSVQAGTAFALLYLGSFALLLMSPLFSGIVQAFWRTEALWGPHVIGVPVEEVAWAFVTGLFSGPLYRVCSQ
jgi:hypothetical protein